MHARTLARSVGFPSSPVLMLTSFKYRPLCRSSLSLPLPLLSHFTCEPLFISFQATRIRLPPAPLVPYPACVKEGRLCVSVVPIHKNGVAGSYYPPRKSLHFALHLHEKNVAAAHAEKERVTTRSLLAGQIVRSRSGVLLPPGQD